MSFLSIDKVHGDHLIDRNSVVMIPQGTVIADTNVMLGKAGGQVESVSLHMLLGRPVAEITTDKGVRMFDAATAMPLPLPLVSAGQAQAIAATAWRGAGRPASSVERVTAATTKYRGALPAWRVSFADSDNTRVFVTETGRIAAVRTGNVAAV